jgi:TrmH family RNA methyltransferase
MKAITSRDNPGFKDLLGLARDAREQRRRGKTLLDGPHLVSTYLARVGQPEMLLASESGLARPEVAELLAASSGVETLVLRDAIFRELSGVDNPVGILAVIAVPPPSPDAIAGSCVLLDAVQDAGNVGAILRTAAAAGIGLVVLGPGCAGAWTPRVLRAAQGAHFSLAIRETEDLQAEVEAYQGTLLATVAHGGRSLYETELAGDLAWLFGNEGAGLSPALVAGRGLRVEIPLAPGSESLNVAAAAAVCLFEAVRQRPRKKGEDRQSVSLKPDTVIDTRRRLTKK